MYGQIVVDLYWLIETWFASNPNKQAKVITFAFDSCAVFIIVIHDNSGSHRMHATRTIHQHRWQPTIESKPGSILLESTQHNGATGAQMTAPW